MTDKKTFLDNVYDLDSTQQTLDLYAQWAQTYDEELRNAGYASPARVADALAAEVADLSAPLLDIGCGTGLSGEALKQAGFATIDGTDFSKEMLEVAATKGIYRATPHSGPEAPIPGSPGDYVHMTAIGVFSPGHATADLIPAVIKRMPKDGCFAFTLNDHALEDPAFEATINRLAESKTVSIAFNEYGEHLPQENLQSRVYVLKKS